MHAQYLQSIFPNVEIEGDNFPIAPWKAATATALQVTFYGGLAMSFMGPPAVKQFLQDHSWLALGGFLASNMLQNALISTGAFEVYLDFGPSYTRETVYSALANGGAVPEPQHIAGLLQRQYSWKVDSAAAMLARSSSSTGGGRRHVPAGVVGGGAPRAA